MNQLPVPMKDLLRQLRISHRQLSSICRIGLATASRLANGDWPKRNVLEVQARLHALLRAKGATAEQIAALQKSKAPNAATSEASREPADEAALSQVEEKEIVMLLQGVALTQEAREHFKLPRNPFVDDIATPDDVFQSPNIRYARAALMDAALHHGFMALVGESGAGKSTLAEDLEERIVAESRDVVVIRPYVLAMEQNDTKGKTLKSSHIAEAIARALDPLVSLKSSPQARFEQVHQMLKDSARTGRRHLLLIEEAHGLPTATLKHLKRFLELKDRMRRLIGVALIAQPELAARLNSQNPEVREVMQRCELVELAPLDESLQGYLEHKFKRFDLKLSEVMKPDAVDAIRARLTYTPRGGKPSDTRSVCYPLVVNNLMVRAMNAAQRTGWPVVDAQVIAGC